MPSSVATSSLATLRERLSELTLRDDRRLRRRLDGVRALRDPEAKRAAIAKLQQEIETARERVDRRRAAVPKLSYPPELPVSQRKDELLAAIRDHQVVIVAGETGSGKTTQLPKICLELGRGVRGMIGHTQPRRLAARTVAARIAEELNTPLGDAVGWKVRFTDQVADRTLVKLMTDGILLAEIRSDRMLRQYDTLIIDEAHERSLNIDFLLGYVKQLLPRRPDLKVIITSATIDPERFARHFGTDGTPAPIVEVSGRTYPVEVRYRPIVDPDDPAADPDRDQTQAIIDAVGELSAEAPGDVLVFLSGEREIRDTSDALTALDLPGTEILPLYARLSAAEQHRVFQRHRGRRVVLATNVAETSLTVPGIKYVIDPGTARISRYSNRLKVQRLPIEPISQASANQRKGRCGRTSDGICVRLYSEDDFAARPEFTDPEILRTNLASVILQMAAADLGDIAEFPFIDPPDRRHITDGVTLLHELGALDPSETDIRKQLTPIGRKLAQLPVDPRLGRIVLAAGEQGCASEAVVLAAALSIQDPRERPAERRQAADQQHARFADKDSDFLGLLNLWRYLTEQRRDLSGNRFRKLCHAEFLNYLRVREWQDLAGQLRQIAKNLGITSNHEPADPARVHQALLAGLLSHIGLKDPAGSGNLGGYLGARNSRFAIFPGSALFKKQPRWVMAAELVETSRLWARMVARIEPDWIEPLAGHLVRRSYSEPRWDAERGAVLAAEKVTLFGLPIVVSRTVNYGRIDPERSRELFIRHALVEGDWSARHDFLRHNRKLLREVEELEHRARRRDILVDDETLFDFYDQRVGREVVSARHFDSWWKKTRRQRPDLLNFTRDMLLGRGAAEVSQENYPDAVPHNGLRIPLRYRFEPGERADGITMRIPVAVLHQLSELSPAGLPWQVPGLRVELITALLRSLPKPIRRNIVPIPDNAKAVADRMSTVEQPSLDTVARALRETTGVSVPRDAWQLEAVPAHLKTTFQVVDERGRTVGEGKDLLALQRELREQVRASLAAAAPEIEREGLTGWSFGELPRTVQRRVSGHQVTGYPSLVDEGDTVAIRVLDSAAEQHAALWLGTRRLLLLSIPSPVKQVVRALPSQVKLALSANPYRGVPEMLDDCVACAADALIAEHGGPVWDAEAFGALRDAVRARLFDTTQETVLRVRQVLVANAEVETRLAGVTGPVFADAVADIRAQLAGLVHAGFVTETGFARLPDLARYLRAIDRRLEKLPERPDRDRDWMASVHRVQAEYERVLDAQEHPLDPNLREVRWLVEELRVSYFAQTLGTPRPVSEKRILRALPLP